MSDPRQNDSLQEANSSQSAPPVHPMSFLYEEDDLSYTNEGNSSTGLSYANRSSNASGISLAQSLAVTVSTFAEGVSRTLKHWKVLVAAQMLSFTLAAGCAAMATLHFDCNLNAPAAQTGMICFLLSLHSLPFIGRNRKSGKDALVDELPVSKTDTLKTTKRTGKGWKFWKRKIATENVNSNLVEDGDGNEDNNSSHASPQTPTSSPMRQRQHLMAAPSLSPPTSDDENSLHRKKTPNRNNNSRIQIVPNPNLQPHATDSNPNDTLPPPHSLFFGCFPLHAPAWTYFLVSLILVEANYFTCLAFRYTTMTSVSLLDNLGIVSAMGCSKLLLRRKYQPSHIVGAIICCLGMVVNIFVDYRESLQDGAALRDDVNAHTQNVVDDVDDFAVAMTRLSGKELQEIEYPYRLFGDLLAMLGGLFVGLNDVLTEWLVKDFASPDEYLGCVGIFGTLISLVQALVFERHAITKFFIGTPNQEVLYRDDDNQDLYQLSAPSTCSQSKGLLLLSAYVFTIYVFNVGLSRFLVVSESALLTLSLLTGDLWAVIFMVFAEKIPPAPMFYIALVMIIIGVFVYETVPSPLGEDSTPKNIQFSPHRQGNKQDSGMLDDEPAWSAHGDSHELELKEEIGSLTTAQREIT